MSIAGSHWSYCINSRSGMSTEFVKCKEGTVRHPSLMAPQASKAGRLKHTSRGGIRLGANQDGKNTKRTAIARGQSNRKRGRQGHRHTMSIAGCIRTDCRDYKSTQMTESWKSEEGDTKSTRSLGSASVQGTQAYGNG